MKTLYLDCGMGAAGDMLTAALYELLPEAERKAFLEELDALGLPGVVFRAEPAVKCGITGTHMAVTVDGEEEESFDHHHPHDHDGHGHDHEHPHDHGGHGHDHEHPHDHGEHGHDHAHHHHHSGLHDIEHIVRGHLALPERVQDDVMAVYGLIAEAESKAHGMPVTEIHFHEVGTMDAIADVTAVCLLLDKLAPDEVVVSPVHVGSGHVHCAHGILPVPAPATATILQGVPIYGGSIQGELCTPTGAALLKHFATRFGEMPAMELQAVGYGMGKKDFPAANCVRAMLGRSADHTDQVLELSCDLDDMTGEELGFAVEELLAGGALDVYTSAVGMKKSRPGTMLQVLCTETDREAMLSLLFRHTTTLGVREAKLQRYVLRRSVEAVQTVFGPVRRKTASGYGAERSKYEYEDLAKIAREQGLSLRQVKERLPR